MKKEHHIVHTPVKGGRHKRDRDISPRVIKPWAILGDRGREGGSKIRFLRRRRLWMFPYLTQVGQQPEEIFAKHGLVGVFVVQLQDLNEIVDATGVLGVLGLFEEGIHVLEADGLLALLLLTTNLSDGLHGGVQVAGANEVTNVETVDLAISLEVIDLEGELDFYNGIKE